MDQLYELILVGSDWIFVVFGACRSVEGHDAREACDVAQLHCGTFTTTTKDDWTEERGRTFYLELKEQPW